jgi:hypothetical protein
VTSIAPVSLGTRPGRTGHYLAVAIAVLSYVTAERSSATPHVRGPICPKRGSLRGPGLLPPTLLLLPQRSSGHGSLESIASRAHSARTAEPVHLAANA